jgi:hypothetical protein
MVCSWCHQSTLDRLATLWQEGTLENFPHPCGFFSADGASIGAKTMSMRAELTRGRARTRGTLVA